MNETHDSIIKYIVELKENVDMINNKLANHIKEYENYNKLEAMAQEQEVTNKLIFDTYKNNVNTIYYSEMYNRNYNFRKSYYRN